MRRPSILAGPSSVDAGKPRRRHGVMFKHDHVPNSLVNQNATPSFMKTFSEGEIFGHQCFDEENPEPYRA